MSDAAASELLIQIKADLKSLKSSMGEAQTVVKQATTGFNNALGSTAILMAEVFAAEKVLEFGKASVEAFAELDHSLNMLGDQLKRNGYNWDELKEKTLGYLEASEKTYKFEKTEVADSLRKLVLLTKDYQAAVGLNTLAMKFAKVSNMDLATASQTLGLAFEGNQRGLMVLARNLGMTAEEAKDVKGVFAELQRQTDGTGASLTDLHSTMQDFGNQLHDVKVLFGELFEGTAREVMTWGGVIIRVLESVGVALVAVGSSISYIVYTLTALAFFDFSNITASMNRLKTSFMGVGGSLSALPGLLQKVWGEAEKTGDKLKGLTAAEIADAAAKKKAHDELLALLRKEAEEVAKLQEEYDHSKTSLQAYEDAIKKTDTGLLGMFITLSNTRKTINRADFKTLADYKAALKEAMKEAEQDGRQKAQAITQFYKGMATSLETAFAAAFKGIKEGSIESTEAVKMLGRAIFKYVISAIGDMLIEKGVAAIAEGIALSTNQFTASSAPGYYAEGAAYMVGGAAVKGAAEAYLAEGGVVDRPTRAVIGEAGPEAVIPLKDSNLNFGGPKSMTVNIHLPNVKNPGDFASHQSRATVSRTLLSQLDLVKRRSGSSSRGI